MISVLTPAMRKNGVCWPITLSLIVSALAMPASAETHQRVKTLEIKILSTMLTGMAGVGEWGFAALVVADGHRILVDTGARPDTVLKNAGELKVDLSDVPDVVLTHNHGDHTSGLITLRESVRQQNAKALAVTHVGKASS